MAIAAKEEPTFIYVILGVDINEHDQVLSVCTDYAKAKAYCCKYLMHTDFYDLWIEKHELL